MNPNKKQQKRSMASVQPQWWYEQLVELLNKLLRRGHNRIIACPTEHRKPSRTVVIHNTMLATEAADEDNAEEGEQ